MQKIVEALRATTAQLARALERGDISGRHAAAAGTKQRGEAALAVYDRDHAEGKDLETVARQALSFITQMRESTEEDPLLDNVEANLALALGVKMEDATLTSLRRRSTYKATTPLGDIEYYLDEYHKELGHVVFPGSAHETVFVQERQWDSDILRRYDLKDLRKKGNPSTAFNECFDLLNRAVNTAELSQDELEISTRQLLSEVEEWMRGLPADTVLSAADRAPISLTPRPSKAHVVAVGYLQRLRAEMAGQILEESTGRLCLEIDNWLASAREEEAWEGPARQAKDVLGKVLAKMSSPASPRLEWLEHMQPQLAKAWEALRKVL
jgi:hypothetical protein